RRPLPPIRKTPTNYADCPYQLHGNGTFQFNERLSDVDPKVGDVNEVLIGKFAGRKPVAQAVQQWWVTGDLGPKAEGAPITEMKRCPDLVIQEAKRLAVH
ncbi:hypothetical protein QP172_08025, partial [Corynebacterium coyleae]|uniref:hypothetical protein n=1 Tax=Corynebacterium coyleae TaxID=53374 RepID=UPI00254E3CDD